MTEPTNQQIDRILLNVKRSGYIQVFNELEKSRAQAERLAAALDYCLLQLSAYEGYMLDMAREALEEYRLSQEI